MSTVLVTGAGGFIGSHTSELLINKGYRVVGVDDFSSGSRKNFSTFHNSSNWLFHECDISQDGRFANIVRDTKPSAIIHLAGLVSVERSFLEPALNYRLNVYMSYLVAEAARQYGVSRLVFASSAAIYGPDVKLPISEEALVKPISPYGVAKNTSEAMLLGFASTYGIVVRCQRYFNVYGTRQVPLSPYSGVISRFVQRFRAGLDITIYGDGQQTRDFIAVEDVARANFLAAVTPALKSGTANICTGTQASLLKLLDLLAIKFPRQPRRSFAPSRNGDIVHSCGDTTRARSDFGFISKVSLEAGIGALVEATENDNI